jgi:hypothetical protein
MPLTDAQSNLVAQLILECQRENRAAVLNERWGVGAGEARRYATEQNRLLLVREWVVDLLLAPDGQVWAMDTETTQPLRVATEEESRFALFRGVRRYPELLSLLPSRPMGAVTCADCGGTGVHPATLENPELRNVVCACSGSGWFVGPSTTARPKSAV